LHFSVFYLLPDDSLEEGMVLEVSLSHGATAQSLGRVLG